MNACYYEMNLVILLKCVLKFIFGVDSDCFFFH